MAFLKGRIDGNLSILDKRLAGRPFVLGERPTIADISLCAYLYYPADEFGFDIAGAHKNIGAWLDRIKALPGWKHPYELMPGYPPTAIGNADAAQERSGRLPHCNGMARKSVFHCSISPPEWHSPLRMWRSRSPVAGQC